MLSTGNILDVAHGGQDDRDDSFGVLHCSVEVEKESQANAGSTRRSLSPNTEEVCPDHAQTAWQNDSGLCVRQLRKNRQIDVVGVPHSQELLPGTSAGKDSGVGPLANPQVTAKGIPGYLPSSPNRPAGILDVADLAAGNAPVKDSPLVGDEGVSGGVEGHALESGRAALPMRCGEGHFHSRHKNSRLRECPEQQVSVSSEHQASPADSQNIDRHGDDRFADNILRALEGLPQNGDAEEENDAAEEGALIEASNMPYPEYERNGR